MPFGIKPASGIFQCQIEKRLSGIKGVAAFIDDIVGEGATFEEMLRRLMEVLQILEAAGFTLGRDKCQMFLSELYALGHKINGDGISKDEEKVAAILAIQQPKDVKEVQSFAGLVTYYAKFVPRLADLMQPFYALLKKDAKFTWSIDH